MELEGRVALVTGAAHRIGKAVALGLAREGMHVVVHYGRSHEAAAETVAELRRIGVEAVALRAELGDPAAIDALFGRFDREHDRLDLLVNSAASFREIGFADTTAADWDETLAVNLRAPFLLTQRAAARMRERARGGTPALIVNLADRSGLTPWGGYAAHGVSKAALLHLTRVSALELAPGVRVNAVIPGAILPHASRPASDPEFLARGERLPARRTGSPEDVVDTIVFLARNDFVTGAAIPVDGGEHLLSGREVASETEV